MPSRRPSPRPRWPRSPRCLVVRTQACSQRQTAASFRCVKSAGAHAVMPRARQAPELSDRCAPRLAFPETGPTRVSSSSWHDCVQQALALIAATTTTARSLGASAPRRPVGANRATWTRCATSKASALSPAQSRCGGECRRRGKSRTCGVGYERGEGMPAVPTGLRGRSQASDGFNPQ